jgi:hypothetical protein
VAEINRNLEAKANGENEAVLVNLWEVWHSHLLKRGEENAKRKVDLAKN